MGMSTAMIHTENSDIWREIREKEEKKEKKESARPFLSHLDPTL